MASMDIFNNDAFNVISLTGVINDLTYKPGRLGELGLFDEKGISTLAFWVERKGNSLVLIPNTPRGAAGKVNQIDKSKGFMFGVTHLPETDSILADEIANVRSFGTETEVKTMQGVVSERLETMRGNLEVTLEYHRLGALKGLIIDADGTTVIEDLFARFGLTKQSHSLILGTAGTNVKTKVIEARRKSEKALGGVAYTGHRALCSSGFFDTLTSHAKVNSDFDRWNNGAFAREDLRKGFPYGGVIWEEYRGGVGNIEFIEDGKALLVPEGVKDMFQTKFGYANYVETVNTPGLPFYAKQEAMRMGKGIDIEAQSNPFCLNTRPDAVVELTL